MIEPRGSGVAISEQDHGTEVATSDEMPRRRATQGGGTGVEAPPPGSDSGRHPASTAILGLDNLQGCVDRFFVSASGYVLVLGWLADEGRGSPRLRIVSGEASFALAPDMVLRQARPDIEAHVRDGAYDYGFVGFGKAPADAFHAQIVTLQVATPTSSCQIEARPEIIADKRLLDTLLIVVADSRAHAGKEVSQHAFLGGAAGDSAMELFRSHVARGTAGHYVERFRPRPVARSFVTVLFGTTEPILLQPVMFRQHGIDFGEWIYVCNSPEDAAAVLRLSRMVSDLYDLTITVIIMTDNVGFGAANNVAIEHAASDAIYIVNPDVYPMRDQAGVLRQTLEAGDLTDRLTGGLLFYDDGNLMHSGMFLERDLFFRSQALNRLADTAAAVGLLRVEHFDKGVPFVEAHWSRTTVVPAITGAVMAFDRRYFERIGGFSTCYIYGHYEDADLSLRWARENGPVVIDPKLRLIHLEGQGSRARGDQYRSAAIVNRFFFEQQHGADYAAQPDAYRHRHGLVLV